MSNTSPIIYGTWADRNTPQQNMWAKRFHGNEVEAINAITRIFSPVGPLQTLLNNTEDSLRHAQNLLEGGVYTPVRNSDISLDVYRTIKHKYNGLFVSTAAGININSVNYVPSGSYETPGVMQSAASKFVHTFQPISSFIGTTLFVMPGVIASNIESKICSTVSGALGKINARLKQGLISIHQALKLDEMSHLPGQIMGSVRNIMSTVNKLLEAPAHIIKDLFQGAISIIQKMNALVNRMFAMLNRVINMALGFAVGLLNTLMDALVNPILEAVGGFSLNISDIIVNFSGLNLLTDFSSSLLKTLSLGNLGALAGGLGGLSNPGAVNSIFANPSAGLTRGVSLNDPFAAASKFIPTTISSKMNKVMRKSSSFGLSGNHGFQLSGKLGGSVKNAVLANVLKNFSVQAGILSHMFTGHDHVPLDHIVSNSIRSTPDGTKYVVDRSRQVVRVDPPNFIFPIVV